MQRLAIMVGFPLSGKSTFCREKLMGEGYAVVCPDTVRLALHGQQYVESAEPFVWSIVQTTARALLMDGHSVVIDATNTTPHARSMWVRMANEFNIQLRIFVINTPKEECLRRNSEIKRLDDKIIERMAKQYVKPSENEGNVVIRHFKIGPVTDPTAKCWYCDGEGFLYDEELLKSVPCPICRYENYVMEVKENENN